MKRVESYKGPHILSLQERAKVVNNLLQIRLETLLPAVMRETGFDTWVILCNEDNHDPVFRTLIPEKVGHPSYRLSSCMTRGLKRALNGSTFRAPICRD